MGDYGRFQQIHLGNAYEFVIKDHYNNKTYGTFEGDKKSMNNFLEDLNNQHDLIQELYEFRLVYNALLFNLYYENNVFEVYKSKRHSDGELCFDGEWFVVVAILPDGQITNHYHIGYWDYFKIPAYDKVKDEFDNHTSQDVLERLKKLII